MTNCSVIQCKWILFIILVAIIHGITRCNVRCLLSSNFRILQLRLEIGCMGLVELAIAACVRHDLTYHKSTRLVSHLGGLLQNLQS